MTALSAASDADKPQNKAGIMEPDVPAGAKTPRTPRGWETRRKLLDAAAKEFAELGFHMASISSITRRAGTALGSFYTYFDSKEALFKALVQDMSNAVRDSVAPAVGGVTGALAIEQAALTAFLSFVADHKEIYRIIDEAEFVDYASFRQHYETTAARISERLAAGTTTGELRDGLGDVEAWALMGMNVFLGLRFGVWEAADGADVAARANRLISDGLRRHT